MKTIRQENPFAIFISQHSGMIGFARDFGGFRIDENPHCNVIFLAWKLDDFHVNAIVIRSGIVLMRTLIE